MTKFTLFTIFLPRGRMTKIEGKGDRAKSQNIAIFQLWHFLHAFLSLLYIPHLLLVLPVS
jgi:hypothetical protein